MNPQRLTIEQRAIVQSVRLAQSITIIVNHGMSDEVKVRVDNNNRFTHDVGLAIQTLFQSKNEHK